MKVDGIESCQKEASVFENAVACIQGSAEPQKATKFLIDDSSAYLSIIPNNGSNFRNKTMKAAYL